MTLDFVFKTCTGHDTTYWSERGDLDWYDAYADPHQGAGKGILTANWNEFPRPGDHTFNWSAKGRKFGDILERMGYQLEWSDQTSRCDHCGGAIQEQPHCYGDTAHYAMLGECDTVCENCIRKDFTDEYLEGLEDNPRAAVNIAGINPANHGYVRLETGFENGFHPGQNDNPTAIYGRLCEKYSHILFTIDASGQFDVRFSVWHKPEPEEQ